ncbi:hypothetical protein Clacol_004659 [Clathrus columnatus]|uniref:NUC153 domain-containing protein n=1 Tax=Clathrus columnatus TaxID=1419009 RepID=A0AAV5AB80_9AGAM|nr:hypothetical protein Clacol_004659 [Clathrus columnatus]
MKRNVNLKHEEKRRLQKGKDVVVDQEDAVEVTEQQPQPQPTSVNSSSTWLTDECFKALFEDPEFEVDTNTREYSLLNPSTSDLMTLIDPMDFLQKQRRTAVEEE